MAGTISTIGQFRYIQSLLQSTESQLNNTQAQISSGRLADTYAGLGAGKTYQSLSLHVESNNLKTYSTNIDSVILRTTSMDNALTNITSVARKVADDLQSKVQSGDPGMSLLNLDAKNALDSVQQYLNLKVDNRYLFAGSDTQNAPIASTTAVNTNVTTDLTAFAAGTETATQVLTNVAAYTSTQTGYSSTLAAAKNVTVRSNDSVDTDYTVKADSSGFQSVMKGLSIIANLQYNPNDSAGFYKLYNSAIDMINTGSTAVDTVQAKLGIASKTLTDTQATFDATQTTLSASIGNAENVNVAEATTKLQNLETQLQVSYNIIGQVKNLSLINYLN